MIVIGKILGCNKGNRDNFAIRKSGTHIGLVTKIGHGHNDWYKR